MQKLQQIGLSCDILNNITDNSQFGVTQNRIDPVLLQQLCASTNGNFICVDILNSESVKKAMQHGLSFLQGEYGFDVRQANYIYCCSAYFGFDRVEEWLLRTLVTPYPMQITIMILVFEDYNSRVIAVKWIEYHSFILIQSFHLISNTIVQKVEIGSIFGFRFDHYYWWFPSYPTRCWIYNNENSTVDSSM